jgi:hypothetical protein
LRLLLEPERHLEGFKETFITAVLNEKKMYINFVQKKIIKTWDCIRIGSGFSNSLDPDPDAVYPDPTQ